MMILKFVLVVICLLGGALFLVDGLGTPIPFVRYKGLEADDLPAGIALLAAGILLAVFWKIRKTTTTKLVEVAPDGTKHIKTKEVDYQMHNTIRDPRDPPGPFVA
jgi:hypothetical protein